MTFSKHRIVAIIAYGIGTAAAPVVAQVPTTPPAITVGTKVVDSAGGEVGTVAAVQGDNLVVKTDKHQAALPKSSFTPGPRGLLFGMTREQLNTEIEKTLAAQGPLLSVGATVYDPSGGVVGTVEAFDAEFATVKLTGSTVKLPLAAFARGPKGPAIGETAASLEAKAKAASSSN